MTGKKVRLTVTYKGRRVNLYHEDDTHFCAVLYTSYTEVVPHDFFEGTRGIDKGEYHGRIRKDSPDLDMSTAEPWNV